MVTFLRRLPGRPGKRVFFPQARKSPAFGAPGPAQPTRGPQFLPSQWEAALARSCLLPAARPRSLRNAASRAIFSPPASAAPLPALSRPPTPNRFPLKCLQACLQAGSPLPHRTTSVTALTTGRSGLDLLKDPGGGACPSLAAWLAHGVGFRPVALERETKGKVLSPPPPGSPGALIPSPSGPRRGAEGPLGPAEPAPNESGYRGGAGGRTF